MRRERAGLKPELELQLQFGGLSSGAHHHTRGTLRMTTPDDRRISTMLVLT